MSEQQSQLREVRGWGNSGGVLVPREWVGKQVKIVLVDRSLEIKREVLQILEPYLSDVIGIYLVGSYARGEQDEDSDIDVLVVSKEIKKSFLSGKYEIEIIPLNEIIELLKNYPIAIYPKFREGKAILNKGLLEEIREIKTIDNKKYLQSCKKILKLDKKLIKRDKREGENLKSYSVVYSALLRLKALYILDCILKNKEYKNKNFKEYIIKNLNIDEEKLNELYNVYDAVLRNKKIKTKISLYLVRLLINLLEKEVLKHEQKEKAT